MIRRPPRSPLFPSTPLSRSVRSPAENLVPYRDGRGSGARVPSHEPCRRKVFQAGPRARRPDLRAAQDRELRSEEHTSELQSPCNLVCRLLLEKKKKKYMTITSPNINIIATVILYSTITVWKRFYAH